MNDYDFDLPPWMKKMLRDSEVVRPTLRSSTPPLEIAYFVGGPADGREMPVSPGMVEYIVPSVVSTPTWTWSEDPTAPASTVEAHRYSPCPETGEWLWRGVR